MKIDPTTPSRADFRFMRELLGSAFKNKIEYIPEEFDRVSKVFCRAGGSWERTYQGSIKDLDLLKRVIKVAIDLEFMTRKGGWW